MIKIGTRGSELALWQANYVADLIGREKTEIQIIKTKGDRIQNLSFNKMEGKGFFTKEIEESLLNKKIDIAVHSMKDLPTDKVPGLKIAAIPKREDPSDILLINTKSYNQENQLPLFENALVGTSSLRRIAQLKYLMNSVRIEPLRGNVTTRIKRLAEKKFDAIILARAGIKRLDIDLTPFKIFVFSADNFLPAPAQGALAIQVREEDFETAEMLNKFNHKETELAVSTERAFLKYFGGGCHIPLGAIACIMYKKIKLSGVVASTDGLKIIRKDITGENPEKLGGELARQMKAEGAEKLL